MEGPLRASADADFRLIETFAYDPGFGIARQDLHLRRLQASARDLGFACDPDQVVKHMLAIRADRPQRCRLTLGRAGDIDLTVVDLPPTPQPFRFIIARQRLASGDGLLRHKTTRRGIYDAARADLPAGVDEALLLNERDELCEGSITNLVLTRSDGSRHTPPLRCGCLAGVYRQSLLDSGQVQETVLTLADLRAARAVHLVNSLRGEIPAQWDTEAGATQR